MAKADICSTPPDKISVASSTDNLHEEEILASNVIHPATPPLLRRQAMIALANAQIGLNTIASIVYYSVDTVRRWIRRFHLSGELHDLFRSGRPALYSPQTQQRLVAFYCQTQPLPGCGRWTLRWAESHLNRDNSLVGATPSKSTIHRVLQRNQLKPHQSSYFLHITDPDFFPKMEHLLDLYFNPPKNLFFFDECPGIQILKRLTPDIHTDTSGKRLEEFEYTRNGTLDVLAFLHHATGKVYIECCDNHKTETFLAVFKRQVNQCCQTEPLHYVMDNLSSHRSYPFCELVAELSGIMCPPKKALSTQTKRVEWLGLEDKRIIIHFTPFHGSWLNWIEFWFGIMGRKVLDESYDSSDALKAALEAFAAHWNLLLAHPFKWSYNGDGLHEKAVNRFTKMLHCSVTKMELRTLTKQMKLLTNLLTDYVTEIPVKCWEQLSAAFNAQSTEIENLIDCEDGPVRKLNAQQAFLNLTTALRDYFTPTKSVLS